MKKEMDIYTDYLLSSFGQVTSTGLSTLLEGSISHDKITRMLLQGGYGSKNLWHEVKSLVREHESPDTCLIFDDTIVSKPYTDE
ncbi:MAG: IS701 family transposase, partial [Cytophagaceae bacterium]|nr:IS701 family transposase [Cytophagaceae bacterium]